MMWRTIIVLLLLFIGFNCSFSQTYWVPRNPFLDSLLKWDITISQIDKTNQLQFLPISHKNQLFKQSIIKYKKDLYILIDGTGQVYKASAQNATKIAFTRLDSTYFAGYNFNAFDFAYKDTIFSFGGEGFWHNNGKLRYFNDGGEWNIISLNKEYPANGQFLFFAPEKSKLVYIKPHVRDLANNTINTDEFVIEFDLITKKNTLLGM